MSEIKEMADHFLLSRRLNLSDSSKQQWPHVYGHRYILARPVIHCYFQEKLDCLEIPTEIKVVLNMF